MRAIAATLFMLCAVMVGAPAVSQAGSSQALLKFAGEWKGMTVCPKLGSWRVALDVSRQPDGSYTTKASTDNAGEFSKMVFRDDTVSLRYSTVFKDTTYVGRLTSPDRMDGTVKIQEDCTWYLTR